MDLSCNLIVDGEVNPPFLTFLSDTGLETASSTQTKIESYILEDLFPPLTKLNTHTGKPCNKLLEIIVICLAEAIFALCMKENMISNWLKLDKTWRLYEYQDIESQWLIKRKRKISHKDSQKSNKRHHIHMLLICILLADKVEWVYLDRFHHVGSDDNNPNNFQHHKLNAQIVLCGHTRGRLSLKTKIAIFNAVNFFWSLNN